MWSFSRAGDSSRWKRNGVQGIYWKRPRLFCCRLDWILLPPPSLLRLTNDNGFPSFSLLIFLLSVYLCLEVKVCEGVGGGWYMECSKIVRQQKRVAIFYYQTDHFPIFSPNTATQIFVNLIYFIRIFAKKNKFTTNK